MEGQLFALMLRCCCCCPAVVDACPLPDRAPCMRAWHGVTALMPFRGTLAWMLIVLKMAVCDAL